MKKHCKTFTLLMMGMLLVSALFTSCGDDDDDNATTDYFYYNGHSYLVVKKAKTWTEAASDAVAMGGYLVEIESKTEQDAVYQGILKAGISSTYVQVKDGGGIGYVWIGATDRYKEGSWIWNGENKGGTFPLFWLGNNTGVAVAQSYVNWGGTSAGKINEPDNFTDSSYSPNGQNAAAIGLSSWPAGSSTSLGIAGEWNDISETNKLYYVVEFDSER